MYDNTIINPLFAWLTYAYKIKREFKRLKKKPMTQRSMEWKQETLENTLTPKMIFK